MSSDNIDEDKDIESPGFFNFDGMTTPLKTEEINEPMNKRNLIKILLISLGIIILIILIILIIFLVVKKDTNNEKEQNEEKNSNICESGFFVPDDDPTKKKM